MTLHSIAGHETLRNRLAGAIASGRFPQASLLSGPPGVGKQRLGLWVAQALLCDNPDQGQPCARCPACRRTLTLTHPDLHWFIPIPRPKATDPDKQVEEAETTLGEQWQARREAPLYGRPDGMASHALASIRLLQRRVGLTPALGRRKVILLGDAERLVVQEASPEAANAILKLLEEPPADTVIMLTASDAQALLPTIRSRLVPVRVGRVADAVVDRFLEEHVPKLTPQARQRRVLLAEGCIGKAIWGEGETDAAERNAERFLGTLARGPEATSGAALGQAPWSARGDFTAMLDAIALNLRGRITAGERDPGRLRGLTQALRRVETIRWDAQGNLNPQLALAVLGQDLERLL